MAKPRKKEIWGVVFTQDGNGAWTWELSGVHWRWGAAVGINLEITVGTVTEGVAHFPKLHDAAFYTFGFEAGVDYLAKKRQREESQKGG